MKQQETDSTKDEAKTYLVICELYLTKHLRFAEAEASLVRG